MIRNWMKMLLAILVGNVIYFAAEPFLPEALAHNLYKVDYGLMVDFAICAAIYLLLRIRRKNE
jgi:hypothetical protein